MDQKLSGAQVKKGKKPVEAKQKKPSALGKKLVKSMSYNDSHHVLAPNQDRKARVSTRSFEHWVETALNALMGPRLQVNGLIDGSVRAVLREFQLKHRLRATGFLDQQTVELLGKLTGVQAPGGHGYEMPAHLRDALRKESVKKLTDKPDKHAGAKLKKGETAPKKATEQKESDASAKNKKAMEHELAKQNKPPRHEVGPSTHEMEALGAVVTMAFDDAFVRAESRRMGRPDVAGLHAEMLRWVGDAISRGDDRLRDLVAKGSKGSDLDRARAQIRDLWKDAHEHPTHEHHA